MKNKFAVFSLLVISAVLFSPFHAFAAPYMTLNVFSGTPMTTLQASGGGFAGGEQLSFFIFDTSFIIIIYQSA
jgi:hypothetical protein